MRPTSGRPAGGTRQHALVGLGDDLGDPACPLAVAQRVVLADPGDGLLGVLAVPSEEDGSIKLRGDGCKRSHGVSYPLMISSADSPRPGHLSGSSLAYRPDLNCP